MFGLSDNNMFFQEENKDKLRYYYSLLYNYVQGDETILRFLNRMNEWKSGINYSTDREYNSCSNDLDYKFLLNLEHIKSNEKEIESDILFMLSYGIRITGIPEKNYPEKLIDPASRIAPIFTYIGDPCLLSMPLVSFSGTRDPSISSIQEVEECVELLCSEKINIISGYCHGVDLTAHNAALVSGGITTAVLPFGMKHFRPIYLFKGVMNDLPLDRILIISQFPVSYPWRVRNALLRNKLICKLSDAVVLVEPKFKTGGTFYTGKQALKLGKPVFLLIGEREATVGEKYFLDRGAKAIHRKKSGELETEKLFQSINSIL